MNDFSDIAETEKTIPAFNGDGETVVDFADMREEFSIHPGEDGLKYRNLKLLGMGGMGIVYCAEDPTLERQVAIKILREPFRCNREQIAKFINEARITARIDHPNIVSVHQLGLNEHHGIYFSMRLISGETLQNVIRHLRENDPAALRHYTTRRLLDIFIAGCNGVAAAHEKKILHCDLKPANIMIGKFGEVLVLDWGLARSFDSPDSNSKISGTPAYMAPELLNGKQVKPDVKSDIYALGTILYSILTWNPAPFDLTVDNNEIAEKAVCGKFLPLRAPHGQHLPRELAAICRKAMHYDRNRRYASVTELLDDLYNYRDGRAVKAYSPNVIYRFFKLCRRHPAIPIAVIVALITLGGYKIWQRIDEYVKDRSLLSSTEVNLTTADEYYRRSMTLQKRVLDTKLFDEPVKIAVDERDMLLQAHLAMMEYFSILDSVNTLSSSGEAEFAEHSAPHIFRRIFELQLFVDDSSKMDIVLERCRRWRFFETACQKDRKLAQIVKNIENNIGILQLYSPLASEKRRGVLTDDDGNSTELSWQGVVSKELPAGNYRLVMDDGVKAKFRIVAGGSEYIELPLPVDSGKVIPADHFF